MQYRHQTERSPVSGNAQLQSGSLANAAVNVAVTPSRSESVAVRGSSDIAHAVSRAPGSAPVCSEVPLVEADPAAIDLPSSLPLGWCSISPTLLASFVLQPAGLGVIGDPSKRVDRHQGDERPPITHHTLSFQP